MRRLFILAGTLLCSACIVKGITPPTVIPAPFSDVEPANMQGMVATHNQVRADHGLPPLRWSGQMAAYAQQWARHLAMNNGCEMEHRTHAKADALEVGENIYWASPLTWTDGRPDEFQQIPPAKVVIDWASEKPDYNYVSNTCRPGAQCGHYTQIVWRTTTEVGCGMSLCPDKAQIWVCSYNPAGNWTGEKPY
ncbi:MAG: CAP domain-containing protein [Thiothrix sp.]